MNEDQKAIIRILAQADLIIAVVKGQRLALTANIQRDIIKSLEQYYMEKNNAVIVRDDAAERNDQR